MSENSSISGWLRELQNGDAAAMQHLWDRYFDKLVRVADQHLKLASTQLVQGEDIAASVLESVWRGAQLGRFREVANVDELLWILLAITKHKCIDQARRSNAQRRGGNQSKVSLSPDPNGLYLEIVSQDPDPQYIAAFNEVCERIIEQLDDRVLQQITIDRLEGFTIAEIAQRIELAESTVRRKLSIIRKVCQRELKND